MRAVGASIVSAQLPLGAVQHSAVEGISFAAPYFCGLSEPISFWRCAPAWSSQLPSVRFIQGRVGDASTLHAVLRELGDQKADVVLSDMAPACTGIRHDDHFNSVELCLYAADLMEQVRIG